MKKLFILLFTFYSYCLIANNPTNEEYFEISKNLEIFNAVYKEVSKTYVDEVNHTYLINTAINKMLYELDPFTNFYPEEKSDELRIQSTGQYGGIGAVVLPHNNKILIFYIENNSPAFKSGLKVGDVIVKVDNKPIGNIDNELVIEKLKGEPGSEINLTITRTNEKNEINFKIIREEIKIKNIPYSGMLKDSIGYIVLEQFRENSGLDVQQALLELKKNNLKGLILDLRGNPGGLLPEAVNVSNTFIKKGQDIVSMKGRKNSSEIKYKTLSNVIDDNIPLVVLVNEYSASASEIVAGSLQDYDRAVIIGRNTYGKGLVQTALPLPYNTELKITSAKYYIPSGRCIQAYEYNENSRGIKIKDTINKPFKTMGGRTVFASKGIKPDIIVNVNKHEDIVLYLFENLNIFNYVNTIMPKFNTKNIDPKTFSLDSNLVKNFINSLNIDEIDFLFPIEKSYKSFMEEIKDFDSSSTIYKDLIPIKNKLKELKLHALNKNKKDIKFLIEREILQRLFFKEGEIIGSLKDDPYLTEAITLLNDKKKYNKILNIKN